MGKPTFLETDGGSGGDIFASHGKGHVAAVRAAVHLKFRKVSGLWRRDKEFLGRPITEEIVVAEQPAIPI